MLTTARSIDAPEAKALGLVDEVHPADALERRVRDLAAQIATFAPLTLAAAKEATRRILAAYTVKDAEDLLLSCYLSEDFQEGVRAFLEKRRAEWKVADAPPVAPDVPPGPSSGDAVDVAVVGAGPAGATAALVLARAGSE